MKYLYEELKTYGKSDAYPFHMPGHKRQKKDFVNPFEIDITEIDGFDNLHHAEELLLEVQQRAAKFYGSEETHYLVNGSTGGILSAVFACTTQGGTLLMARNCHKAAYHAAFLRELDLIYLCPKAEDRFGINGGITPEQVEECLRENTEIQAVLITSPTYDGVVMDVKAIAETAHKYGVPLIVDEAHGAHFGIHPYFPESSVRQGVDVVIHSLHKTLPSLTQTALLHRNGTLVNPEEIQKYLGIFQTSSPSYVFMAGMDECVRTLEIQGKELFEAFKEKLETFYKEAEGLQKICLVTPKITGQNGIYDFDRSKLILSVKGTEIDGNQLQQKLREAYQLELEMAAGSYALALTSIYDTKEGFERLARALKEIDAALQWKEKEETSGEDTVTRNPIFCKISEALKQDGETILFTDACGKISQEFLYLYPPGIPLLVPGEVITEEITKRVEEYKVRGYALQGLEDYQVEKIKVVRRS